MSTHIQGQLTAYVALTSGVHHLFLLRQKNKLSLRKKSQIKIPCSPLRDLVYFYGTVVQQLPLLRQNKYYY